LAEGSEVVSTPYLGGWTWIESDGETPDWNVSIDVVEGEGEILVATVTLEDLPPIDVNFFLTEVGEEVVFCIRHPMSRFWNLFVGALEENNTLLSLRRLDETVIEADIIEENLAGYSKVTQDSKTVRIQAASSDLRTYIENTTNAFEEAPYFVFEKVDP
jgi:hypothetical protein